MYLDGTCVAYKEANVIVSNLEQSKRKAKETDVLIIGDSITANGIMIEELDRNCKRNNLKINFIGTQGDKVYHEGRSGWTIEKYLTDSESPFIFDKELNFKEYIRRNGLKSPDYVILNLGINDVFGEKNDILLQEKVEQFYNNYMKLIEDIKNYDEDITIGISIPIPPANSESSFGKAYQWQTQWRYKKNNLYLSSMLINRFESKKRIHIIPIYLGIDTEYNMGMEKRPVNSKSNIIMQEVPANGSVHPDESGYGQIADEYLAWLIYMQSYNNS